MYRLKIKLTGEIIESETAYATREEAAAAAKKLNRLTDLTAWPVIDTRGKPVKK